MRLFLIAYDLARSSPHKHAIATAIMNLSQAWARPLETTWYVRSESSEGEIQHSLAGLLDPEDGLIVQPVSEGAAMANTALRWFRRRRSDADHTDNVIAFPAGSAAPIFPSVPLAEAV